MIYIFFLSPLHRAAEDERFAGWTGSGADLAMMFRAAQRCLFWVRSPLRYALLSVSLGPGMRMTDPGGTRYKVPRYEIASVLIIFEDSGPGPGAELEKGFTETGKFHSYN